MAGTERELVNRWIEDGGKSLDQVLAMFHECDAFKAAAQAAQKQCGRLLQE